MEVFVAGASGALGKRLIPQLLACNYEVTAMTSSPEKTDALRAMGAEPVVADGLDRDAVLEAVLRSEPEVIIHQMTSLTGVTSFKHFDDEFALTNRLRTEGTDHLLGAAKAAGVRRVIVQSYGNWNYERTRSGLKIEGDPFDPNPPNNLDDILCMVDTSQHPVRDREQQWAKLLKFCHHLEALHHVSCGHYSRRYDPFTCDITRPERFVRCGTAWRVV